MRKVVKEVSLMRYKKTRIIKKNRLYEMDKIKIIGPLIGLLFLAIIFCPFRAYICVAIITVTSLYCMILYFVTVYKILKTRLLPLNENELKYLKINDIDSYCDFLNKFYHTRSILKYFYNNFDIQVPSEFNKKEINYFDKKVIKYNLDTYLFEVVFLKDN